MFSQAFDESADDTSATGSLNSQGTSAPTRLWRTASTAMSAWRAVFRRLIPQRPPQSRRTTISFVTILIMLIVNGVFVHKNILSLHDAHRDLVQSYETIRLTDRILSTLVEAEAGVCGYILTNESSWLEPLHNAEAQLPTDIERLRTGIMQSRIEPSFVDVIQDRITDRMDAFQSVINIHSTSGIAPAQAFIKSGVARTAMNRLSESIGKLTAEENLHLQERTQYAAQQLYANLAANLVVLCGGLVISTLAWRMTDGHIRQSLVAESKADSERENLLVTLASIADAVVVTDSTGRIQMANPVAQKLMGVDSSVIGRRLRDVFTVVYESTREPAPHAVDQVLVLGATSATPDRTLIIRTDGTEIPIEENASPILNKAGTVMGAVLVFRDCSERRRFERKLLEREQHVSRMLQTPLIGIAVCASDGRRMLEANDTFLSLLGNANSPLAGSTLSWDGIMPSRGPLDSAAQKELRETGLCRPFEKACRRRDGKVVPVLISANKLSQEEDRIVVFVMDLSESKRSEASLKESETRFLTLAESMPQIVWLARVDGKISYTNQNWATYAGWTVDQFQGWGWTELLHPEDKESHLKAWQLSLDTAQPFQAEHRLRHHSGDYRWHLTRALPMYNDAKQITQWVGTTTDIHDHKEVESLLKEEHLRKDQFLAMLAHELRNPLAPLANIMEVLAVNPRNAEKLPELLPIMKRQVTVLTRLIDDLMDVARVTQGRMTLHQEPVTVAAIVNAALEASKSIMMESQHQLSVTLPREASWVNADLQRMVQAISNLLHNAARYTQSKGKISLTVDPTDTDVFIYVRDNGQGIAPNMLNRIFEPFMHIEPTLDRVPGGLGIGLSLVRTLVELHDGDVSVHSEGAGKGTEFVIRLPLISSPCPNLPDPAPVEESSAATLHRLRIVVADDVKASARTLAMMLTTLGQDTEIVFDGPSAIAELSQSHFHMAFLDIAMPGMDGLEVARHLRSRPEFANLFLVALTGFGQEDDRIRSLAAGFDEHLIKPTSLDSLTEVLKRAGRQMTEPRSPVTAVE